MGRGRRCWGGPRAARWRWWRWWRDAWRLGGRAVAGDLAESVDKEVGSALTGRWRIECNSPKEEERSKK